MIFDVKFVKYNKKIIILILFIIYPILFCYPIILTDKGRIRLIINEYRSNIGKISS